MNLSRKTWMSLLSAAALVAIILLASSLGGLEFQPGRLFSLGSGEGSPGAALLPEFPGPDYSWVFRLLGIIIVVSLPIGIIMLIVSPESRRILMHYIRIMLPIVALFVILMQWRGILENQERESPPLENPNIFPQGEAVFPQGAVTNPPAWAVYLISFLVIALVVIGAWFVYNRYFRPTTVEKIARDAKAALQDLHSGAELHDVIKRCYYDMSETLRSHWGYKRDRAMTTREFETRLIDIGLPADPVRQLTRLFESVRYGGRSATSTDEERAVACLSAIVAAMEKQGMAAPGHA